MKIEFHRWNIAFQKRRCIENGNRIKEEFEKVPISKRVKKRTVQLELIRLSNIIEPKIVYKYMDRY